MDILSDMDWDEGIAIPVSNFENKHLEDEVKHKTTVLKYLRGLENPDLLVSILFLTRFAYLLMAIPKLCGQNSINKV